MATMPAAIPVVDREHTITNRLEEIQQEFQELFVEYNEAIKLFYAHEPTKRWIPRTKGARSRLTAVHTRYESLWREQAELQDEVRQLEREARVRERQQEPSNPLNAMAQQLHRLQDQFEQMEQSLKWDPANKKLVPRAGIAVPRLRADFVRNTRSLYQDSMQTLIATESRSPGDEHVTTIGKLDSPTRKAIQAVAKDYVLQEFNSSSLFRGVHESVAKVERSQGAAMRLATTATERISVAEKNI